MRKQMFPHLERLEPRTLLNAVAVGNEFAVNTFTLNSQAAAATAMDADGNFIVSWESISQDGSAGGIYAQRYDASGAAAGPEFRVNTFTTGQQLLPNVAMDPDGDFVIAWHSSGETTSYEVKAQRYNAAGVPQGTEFQVNTYTTLNQAVPAVAMDDDGNFIVVWQSYLQDGSDVGVYARRYSAAGVPDGGEFRVNTFTTGLQGITGRPVGLDSAGNFVITWVSVQDGSGAGIYAQRYDASGVPQGAEFRVNTHTTSEQRGAAVAVGDDGDFVVTWRSEGQDGSGNGVYAQRYNALGAAQGSEFQVNTFTPNHQYRVQTVMDADGDFTVVWNSFLQDGDGYGVYAQQFNAAGGPQGSEFRANSFTTNNQSFPTIAMDTDGDFVIAWASAGQDGSGDGVYAQRYGVVPEVTASAFQFATAPHKLNFTFDRDVSASLGTDDLVVQNLTTMQTIPSTDFSIDYDVLTNHATFAYTGTTAGIAGMLPDGNYTATLIASAITTIQGAPLASNYVQNFRFLQADADNDGRVNLNDFNILAGNFGQSPRDFTQGDFDYDTIVNLNDFNILAGRFGLALASPDVRQAAAPDNAYRDRDNSEADALSELLE